MNMDLSATERALQEVAKANHITVEQVKKEIQLAMLVGMCSQESGTQKNWREIPCAGEVPTPEELIAYCVGKVEKCLNS